MSEPIDLTAIYQHAKLRGLQRCAELRAALHTDLALQASDEELVRAHLRVANLAQLRAGEIHRQLQEAIR